ncbi:MAG: hypothetical protein WKG06_06320 [Segetibacter sp.]
MRNGLLLFLFFLILSGCNNSEDIKTVKTVNQERKIDKINFFMETSGSMAGYLKGSTDFVKTIPNLLIAIEQKIDSGKTPVHSYYIADTITPFTGTTKDFIYEISTKHPAKEKSSEMHRIFKMIADKTDSNDISIFVSDCILSYSDKDIKANPEINREKAEGGLKPFITSAFNDLQKKNDMCASIYGFNSSFYGNYYTYQNTKIPLKGNVIRPYYLWVIGNRDLLKKFNSELKKLESFKPDNISIDFGIFDKLVTDYNIFFKFKKSGEWEVGGKGLTNVKVSKAKPATFTIGADLSALPDYVKDTAYLLQNLHKNNENVDFKIRRVLLQQGIDRSDLKKNEQDAFNQSTHLFLIEIDNIYKPKADLKITLPLQYDTSYRKLSIMDDRKVANISGKTFAFQHLVDGVRSAYQNSNQEFINISIPIKK